MEVYMDNYEIEYSETFVNSRVTNNPQSIQYVIRQIKEVHPIESGWHVSEPIITENSDGLTVTIKVQLTKYKVDSLGRSR